MYQRILVPHENTRTDRVIIDHVRQVARHCGASIVFIPVADGAVLMVRELQVKGAL